MQLLTGIDEAGWHTLDAETSYTLMEGGPVAITLSHNGTSAYGHRLLAPSDSLKVGPGVLQATSCLGAFALLRVQLSPDAALTDRKLAPDDWVPGPEGRPKW